MRLSDDFHVELFAAEPDVMSPVEMAFDENGKIYVAEMMDYPDDPPAGKPARSRIRLLQDTNGDGKVDRTTIFADQVLAVSGFMPWKGGLIVTSAPDILFMKDENGDGKADIEEGAVYRISEGESRGAHHESSPRAGQLDLLFERRVEWNGSRRPIILRWRQCWCAVPISASIRSAGRRKPHRGRRSSAPRSTISAIGLSRRTPLISGTS